MAASKIQDKGGLKTGNSTIVLDSNITPGNAIAVAIFHIAGSQGSWTVSDSVNGTYAGSGNNNNVALTRFFRNSGAGVNTISITAPAGGTEYYVHVFEVAGLSNSATILFGTGSDALATSHNALETGISGTGFSIVVSTFSSVVNVTPGSGWTLASPATNFGGIVQYKIATFVSDLGPFTTSSNVNSTSAMSIYPEAPVTGALPFITVLGAKRI